MLPISFKFSTWTQNKSSETIFVKVSAHWRTSQTLTKVSLSNLCLLSYAGLSPKETALILNQSPNTVNMARTRIRQKMDLEEPGADFCAVLEKAYLPKP